MLFDDYFELVTKQKMIQEIKVTSRTHELELLHVAESGKLEPPYHGVSTSLSMCLQKDDVCLTKEKLERICKLSSSETPLTLSQSILLGSYRALYEEDYRKAVVETATASEIALTNAIVV